MPYNETFEKLKAAQNPAFAEEIEAVKDNQTFFIGAYESSPEGNIPKGDFNEIFQALLNNDKALKILAEAIQTRTITAGNGLQGGGNLTANRTINVVSADDSITVGADNIKVNTYDGVDSESTTRPGSAKAVKQAYDKGKEGLDKANEKVSKSGDIMTGALEVKLPTLNDDSFKYYQNQGVVRFGYRNSIPRIRIAGDGTEANSGFNIEGGGDSVLFRVDSSAELYAGTRKVYHTGNFNPDLKQNKTDSNLQTDSKEIVPAINESLWRSDSKEIGSTTERIDVLQLFASLKDGFYSCANNKSLWSSMPDESTNAFSAIKQSVGRSNSVYCSVILKDHFTNKMWINTLFENRWKGWVEILNAESKLFLGNAGVSKKQFIQDDVVKNVGDGYTDKDTGKLYYCYKQAPANIKTPDSDYFYLATNIENSKRLNSLYKCELLYQNTESKQIKGLITLKKNIKEFDRIMITVGNFKLAFKSDLVNYYFEVPALVYNDTDTINNKTNEYSLRVAEYGIGGLYFRSNGTNIYISNYAVDTDSTVYEVYGIKYR